MVKLYSDNTITMVGMYLNIIGKYLFRTWMYLEPIFASPDIKDQLPIENKKFGIVERTWRRIMKITLDKPWVEVSN